MKKERAKPIEWPLPWGASTYVPSIIASEGKVLLVFATNEVLPNYDPFVLKIVGDTNSQDYMAIVEFPGLIDFKFGWINDDPISLPYFVDDPWRYRAYEVENSRWLKNPPQTYSAEEAKEQAPKDYRHFLLVFHDSRFECIAKSYYIEAYSSNSHSFNTDEVLEIAYNRVTGTEWWMKGSKSDFRCPSGSKYLGKHVYANFCMHCGTRLVSP